MLSLQHRLPGFVSCSDCAHIFVARRDSSTFTRLRENAMCLPVFSPWASEPLSSSAAFHFDQEFRLSVVHVEKEPVCFTRFVHNLQPLRFTHKRHRVISNERKKCVIHKRDIGQHSSDQCSLRYVLQPRETRSKSGCAGWYLISVQIPLCAPAARTLRNTSSNISRRCLAGHVCTRAAWLCACR